MVLLRWDIAKNFMLPLLPTYLIPQIVQDIYPDEQERQLV